MIESIVNFFTTWWTYTLIIWIGSIPPGLYLCAINYKIIYVRDLLWGLMFGPIWLAIHIADLNTILWKAKPKNE